MLATSKSAFAGSMTALAVVAMLTLVADASAQTLHKPAHRKVHALAPQPPKASPLAPGVELQTSTSAAAGSENHYFSDTVASSHTDLMDLSYRYGQTASPRFDSTEPLFRF
jgi:hypothetical protein